MSVYLDENGFGKTWNTFLTDSYRGHHPRMTDYHMHDYYEISLILEGHVKVLLPGHAESGTGSKLVLMRPRTPHFIVNDPSVLYARHNVQATMRWIGSWKSTARGSNKSCGSPRNASIGQTQKHRFRLTICVRLPCAPDAFFPSVSHTMPSGSASTTDASPFASKKANGAAAVQREISISIVF